MDELNYSQPTFQKQQLRNQQLNIEGYESEYILSFAQIGLDHIASVGGKNASLGEMIRELSSQDIQVPPGFAITSSAYQHFLRFNGLDKKIKTLLRGLNSTDIGELQKKGMEIRESILAAEIPQDLCDKILQFYAELGGGRKDAAVAVRSSATAEDLPDSSFAGQLESFLNVRGSEELLNSCKKCFASLFTDRVISYRAARGFSSSDVSLSVGVQKMVRSDLASAGVAFSIDTETGFRDLVIIHSSWGLGEAVVQGTVNPDEFLVFKPALEKNNFPIIKKSLGAKEVKVVNEVDETKTSKTVPVSLVDRQKFSLEDSDIIVLGKWVCKIEEHYSKKHGRYTPMDIEWAKDGETGKLYIVQARPETVQSQADSEVLEVYKLSQRGNVILSGQSVGLKIAKGRARVIDNVAQLNEVEEGEILIADRTDPDWEPAMGKVTAIVTNRGGRTCHAAIVSREMGVPAVVGSIEATTKISTGQEITVSCAEGEIGFVYEGLLDIKVEKVNLKDISRPKTQIMMNISNPDDAFHLSRIPNEGVGLARLEFIISNHIKIHPMALVKYDELEDRQIQKQIEDMTAGYARKTEFFVDKLAEGIAQIAAAFFPKDVIVRFSDFKTNEYANLIGGKSFEPHEENPMLGFRGASRYYNERYRQGFALECQAVKKVREQMGLSNVKVMVPFCRTIEEGQRVVQEMEKNGLRRKENGLEIYVMCEIPSNVILAEQFADIFDGFSIGSNDLTQLVLGVDRDSEIIFSLFDERNEAVESMISAVIEVAKKKHKKIGICGQAPSDYPEFAKFIVEKGIDSISLNPDVVLKNFEEIARVEKSLSL